MPSTASSLPKLSNSSSTSGITTTAGGSRHIPSSTRPDGSTRKEIRIRPGYRPPEDVEVYKNRTAEAWKTRGSGGVPGAAGLKEGGEDDREGNKTSGKSAKRREARKKAKATVEEGEHGAATEEQVIDVGVNGHGHELTTDLPLAKEHGKSEATAEPAAGGANEERERADREKQARKLKKKLREARELQAKKDQGEGLLQEQFEKVIRIKELMRDLERLGFGEDADENTTGADKVT